MMNLTNKKINQKPLNNPNSIKSLRSIINETRVPLSRYINQNNQNRTSIQKRGTQYQQQQQGYQKLSYFQKLKGRLVENAISYNNQKESMQNLSQVVARTINVSRSVERDRSRTKNKIINQLNHNRLSYQPKKTVKTENQTIQVRKDHLPPKPFKEQLKINKPHVTLTKMLPEQNTNDSEQSKTEMIEHIHSFRRLNFVKQQERRTQMIRYCKKFEKISVNPFQMEMIEKIQKNVIEVHQVLGTGAYAFVKVGSLRSSLGLGCHKLAIKIYEKYKLLQPSRKRRVVKQIQILSKISHPNIIRLFCAYQDKRQIHMLFECLEDAITLQQYFKHLLHQFNNINELMYILKEIAKGLEYLHKIGIAHRDIKPDNILLSFKNDQKRPIVKIIDFGFAINSVQSKTQCGTPNFMAPELFLKKTYKTFPTDIWSFGVMLYYLLQGKYPFKGYNEKELIRMIMKNSISFERTNKNCQNFIVRLLECDVQRRLNSSQLVYWFESQIQLKCSNQRQIIYQ